MRTLIIFITVVLKKRLTLPTTQRNSSGKYQTERTNILVR